MRPWCCAPTCAGPARRSGWSARLVSGIFDSIAVTLWACLIATGVDPSVVRGWGGVFANPQLLPPAASVSLRQHS